MMYRSSMMLIAAAVVVVYKCSCCCCCCWHILYAVKMYHDVTSSYKLLTYQSFIFTLNKPVPLVRTPKDKGCYWIDRAVTVVLVIVIDLFVYVRHGSYIKSFGGFDVDVWSLRLGRGMVR
jgi:hypothetical protein